MQDQDLKKEDIAVGMNQTLRAIKKGQAEKIYFASDASEFMKEKITNALSYRQEQVPIIMYESMEKLGNACGISRNAVCAVVIKKISKEEEE